MSKLGVIVPYRNREEHLIKFTKTIRKHLPDDSEIIVVEQYDKLPFNRGKLLNIGFKKAVELGCDYVVFHDVDMLPVSADYSYKDKPTHLITKLNTPEDYNRTLFSEYFGGVTLFPVRDFKKVNGYSNDYQGWGFEDDDLLLRCRKVGIPLESKTLVQSKTNRYGLRFNGKNSYVGIPNPLKRLKNFTLVVDFYLDNITPDEKLITDNLSIWSIPGFDTTLKVDSFNDLSLQFWKSNLDSISINSKVYFPSTYQVVVTFTQKEVEDKAKLFVNSELVGENSYDFLDKFTKKPTLYLGVGDPDRDEKQNYFSGVITSFAVIDKAITETEVENLFNLREKSFLQSELKDNLVSYYDMNHVLNNSLLDLVGKNNGIVKNCVADTLDITDTFETPLPHRIEGEFDCLSHSENGYVDGYWASWDSRVNQIKYLKERNKLWVKDKGFTEDGLSNLKFKLRNEIDSPEGYKLLRVKL